MICRIAAIWFIVISSLGVEASLQCLSIFQNQSGELFATGPLGHDKTMPSARSYRLQTPNGPLVYHVFEESLSVVGLLSAQTYLIKLHNNFENFFPRQVNGDKPDAIENDPNVNCHGYAASQSRIPGLPERTWIQSLPTERNLGKSPVQVLLKTYFKQVASFSSEDFNLDTVATNSELKPGDWVVFSRTTVKDGPMAIHSGLVIANLAGPGRNWVRSKLGSGITVENEISMMTYGGYQPASGYDSRAQVWPIDRIDVYRRR